MKTFKFLILGLALTCATSAHAQVVGAGPFGVGTPVATPYNSGYYPYQAHQLNNALGLPYYGVQGYAPNEYYGDDRRSRRALRRQRRARRIQQQQVSPYYYRGY